MSEELKNQPAVDTGAAEEVSEQVAVRMDKMHKLEEKGILPFGHAYKVTHHNKEVHDKVKELEEKGAEVRVAGRLTAIRGHGKTAFMDLLDKSGKIQLYVRKDELGEDNYSVVKLLDIGDIVGVEGEVFTTHMGEPSIRVKKLEFLSKGPETAAGKMARPQGQGNPLSSALCGSHCKPRSPRHICQTYGNHQKYPQYPR